MSGNGANAGLADTGFDERVSHPGLGSGIKAGPVLAQIVDIGTAHDHGVGSCDVGVAQRGDRCVQVGLAEVTAVGRIREVPLVLKLIRTNELECPTVALGVRHDSAGALPRYRRGDGVRDDGCRWRSAVSDRRQQQRVDSPAAGDDDRAAIGEDAFDRRTCRFGIHACCSRTA